jgi:hypothetical protein
MRKMAILIASVALLLGVSGAAQESRSEISLQGTGFLSTDSTGQGTTQRSTNTGGFLIGYRYHFNRWLAADAVYGYGRNTQNYFAPAGLSRIQANVHQATGNTFGTVAGAQRQATGVFEYGGGADFPIVKHIALRAEYRGLVYNSPDFGLAKLNTNTTTHTAQPSAGIVFRF